MLKPRLGLFLCLAIFQTSTLASSLLYVSSPSANAVRVIEQTTNAIVDTIAIDGTPSGLALNEADAILYVANATATRVDIVDTRSNLSTGGIRIAGVPSLLAYAPDSRRLYVRAVDPISASQFLSVIDVDRKAVVANVSLPSLSQSGIVALAVDRARGFLYVLDKIGSAITIVSTSTNQIVGGLQGQPELLANDFALAAGSRLFVASALFYADFDLGPNPGTDFVTVVDASQNIVLKSIHVGDEPGSVIADPTRPLVYVHAYSHLVAIDTATDNVAWSIETPPGSGPMVIGWDGTVLYLSNRNSHLVTVVDIAAQKIVARIPLDDAFAMVASPPIPNIVPQADNGQCVPAFGIGPPNNGPPTTPQPATVIPKGHESVRICVIDGIFVDHITVMQADNRVTVTLYDTTFSFGPNPVMFHAVDVGPLAAGHYVVDVVVDAAVDATSAIPNPYYPYDLAKDVPFDIATAALPPANYQGLWFNPNESGWGINFAHQGDLIFASWFTYDLSGKGTWLVMTASKTTGTTYSGQLVQGTGPAFDAVPFPALGSPGGAVIGGLGGTGTVTFSDANNATFTYTLTGITQTKTITRELFGPQPTCVFGGQPNLALATNYTDLWWASPPGSEAGWGINLTHQGDTIFATWFTFDHDHNPMWLAVQANRTAPNSYVGKQAFRLTGPPFSTVPFPGLGSPGGPLGSLVGSASFYLGDGNRLYFSYTIDGVSQTKEITREVFVAPGTTCQ